MVSRPVRVESGGLVQVPFFLKLLTNVVTKKTTIVMDKSMKIVLLARKDNSRLVTPGRPIHAVLEHAKMAFRCAVEGSGGIVRISSFQPLKKSASTNSITIATARLMKVARPAAMATKMFVTQVLPGLVGKGHVVTVSSFARVVNGGRVRMMCCPWPRTPVPMVSTTIATDRSTKAVPNNARLARRKPVTVGLLAR